jgi:hypothetical protein
MFEIQFPEYDRENGVRQKTQFADFGFSTDGAVFAAEARQSHFPQGPNISQGWPLLLDSGNGDFSASAGGVGRSAVGTVALAFTSSAAHGVTRTISANPARPIT